MSLNRFGALALAACMALPTCAAAKPTVRFRPDGKLTIVQFTDIHNGRTMDPRTAAAMSRIVAEQKPDLVILTGDNVSTGECSTPDELREAIRLLAEPMESAGVPWVVTFGNHENDNLAKLHVTKLAMYDVYRRFPHNVNPRAARDTYGVGNTLLLVPGREGKPALGVWLLDSNGYAPDTVGGQKLAGYDWIHASQVNWYFVTSVRMEKTLGHKLPGLMFFHIPLPEYTIASKQPDLAGERNEGDLPSAINGGLLGALIERGDVLGVYVGHDHTNTWEGKLYGIRMGYGGSIGYAAYGLGGATDAEKQRIRGARVFVIDENSPADYESHYVYADQVK